jgi:Cu-Zn family superoxide dismutase
VTRRLTALAVLALAVAAPAASGNHDSSLPARYIVPGDAVFPEGITREPGTDRFYVSSTNGGAIYRGDVDRRRLHVFLPAGANGRTNATGIEATADGRLYVSGADTGRIFIYRTSDGALLKSFRTSPVGFLNDVAVTPAGGAFFTDSIQPVLYRVSREAARAPGLGMRTLTPWLRFEGTPLVYREGFNVNGIVSTRGGKHLFVVQSNTGLLFRIDIATKRVFRVPIAGGDLTAGDGMLLRGHTLYVAQNAFNRVTKVQLADDLSRGRIVGSRSHPSFNTPTTLEAARGHLMVVNAQFNAASPGPPFTVSTIPLF